MNSTYIYVASSWRNPHYTYVMQAVRGIGAANPTTEESNNFGVHDFRDVAGHFHWFDIDLNWENWTTEQYRDNLHDPKASVGYDRDMGGLLDATACLLVGPCGRSAHLELGYAAGRGLNTAIYLPEPQEPELMYRMANHVFVNLVEVLDWASNLFEEGEE